MSERAGLPLIDIAPLRGVYPADLGADGEATTASANILGRINASFAYHKSLGVNGGVKMYRRGGVKMYCGLGGSLSP